MQNRVLVLAGTRSEAAAYARHAGLSSREFIYASSRQALEGVIFHKIVELETFVRRPDKHAINAVVRRSSYKTRGRVERMLVQWPVTVTDDDFEVQPEVRADLQREQRDAIAKQIDDATVAGIDSPGPVVNDPEPDDFFEES